MLFIKGSLKEGQVLNLRELAQEALDNWDVSEMSKSEIEYLERTAAMGDENFVVSGTCSHSYRDEWDLLAELSSSSG